MHRSLRVAGPAQAELTEVDDDLLRYLPASGVGAAGRHDRPRAGAAVEDDGRAPRTARPAWPPVARPRTWGRTPPTDTSRCRLRAAPATPASIALRMAAVAVPHGPGTEPVTGGAAVVVGRPGRRWWRARWSPTAPWWSGCVVVVERAIDDDGAGAACRCRRRAGAARP